MFVLLHNKNRFSNSMLLSFFVILHHKTLSLIPFLFLDIKRFILTKVTNWVASRGTSTEVWISSWTTVSGNKFRQSFELGFATTSNNINRSVKCLCCEHIFKVFAIFVYVNVLGKKKLVKYFTFSLSVLLTFSSYTNE